MTSVSKSMCINNLDNIVNKYNNIYRRTFKVKPVDVNRGIYIDFNKETEVLT